MKNNHPIPLFHAMALFAVVVWGVTFVSTKILLNHGLTAAEIMLYRFLVAYLLILLLTFREVWARNDQVVATRC